MNLIPTAQSMLQDVTLSQGPWLSILVALPALIAALIWFLKPLRKHGLKIALGASVLMLASFIVIAFMFDWSAAGTTQLVESYYWIPQVGVTWSLGVNALGLVMLLLTGMLVTLVLFSSKEDQSEERETGYAALMLLLYSFIVMIFTAFDLIVFYIAFEAMLIPLFFMIGSFGKGENRRKAAMKFLIYSLFGGLVMLGGIIVILATADNTSGAIFRYNELQQVLPTLGFGVQMAIFIPIFIAFAIKAPMVPVHTWLPDTAAEARPGTSVILVGILDKIGTYGMIVVLLFMLPAATEAVRPTILVLAVISVLWGGFAANGQKNLLRLVSFTSVSHFGFMILGIFIGSDIALTGAMFFMVAHGLSIAALFLISGWLIDRGGSASVMEYGGMQRVTPVLAGTWLFAGLASIALPGLSGFVPEFLILMGTYKISVPLALFAVMGVILAALYILMPYQRIFTGRINQKLADVPDLSSSQKWIIAPILVGTVVLGIWSAPLVGSFDQISQQGPLLVESSVPSASAANVVEGNDK